MGVSFAGSWDFSALVAGDGGAGVTLAFAVLGGGLRPGQRLYISFYTLFFFEGFFWSPKNLIY